MRVCGVAILYQPNFKNVENCVENLQILKQMVVVVNGPDSCILDSLRDQSGVKLLIQGCNTGIAKATNDGVKAAVSFGCDFVCLLDQDTRLPGNYLELGEVYKKCSAVSRVGVVAPVYCNPTTGVKPQALDFHKLYFVRKPAEGLNEVAAPIASGSLISVSLFSDVGMMEEKLFIDYVDTEFALRAKKLGYKNYMSSSVVVEHFLGEQQVRRLLFWRAKPTFHSPTRKYYISRNRLYVVKKYWRTYPSIIFFEMLAISLDIFRIVAYEDSKLEKIKCIFSGFKDFFVGRYGVYK